jgi:predicted MPP superfamily phosphohydrolase
MARAAILAFRETLIPSASRMLRFLQLSDIHFRSTTPGDAQAIQAQALDYDLRERLIADARRVVGRVGGICGVLVCGDLAQKGETSEFNQAATWLQELCNAVGVAPWMVWVVPGNHDLDRTKVSDRTLELRRQLRESGDDLATILADSIDRQALLGPLDNYLEFASAFDCMFDQKLAWVELLDLDGLPLELHGLNSALLCEKGESPEDRRTLIGAEQATFEAQDGLAHYTMCHHPRCWLLDATELDARFEAHVHVRVTGHVHRRSFSPTAAGVYIRAGAVSPGRASDGNYSTPEVPSYDLVSLRGVGQSCDRRIEIAVVGRHWNQEQECWEDARELGLACTVRLGEPPSRAAMALPEPAPTGALELADRELRYRLARLPAYDRWQCLQNIDGPLAEAMQAPEHQQVEYLFAWAKVNERLADLRQAVREAELGNLQTRDANDA